MKLATYVADFIAEMGVNRVYAVSGAGAMHLNDAICNHTKIKCIAMHHEQAATMAAEADARVTGRMGVVHVTAGPGGTNTMTGLASAWADSIPMLIVSGQVTSFTTVRGRNLRQLGTNELDVVSMVRPVTKYAEMITEPATIRYHLEKAIHLATNGRPGPVWIDIPLDVQAAEIDVASLQGFKAFDSVLGSRDGYLARQIAQCIDLLNEAERPVVIIGNGIRLAGACDELNRLIDALRIPVLSSWNASDMIATDHSCCIGRPGLFGDRPGNFALQNSDLVFAIGTRLSIPQIGHHPQFFARAAKQIIVDIDEAEVHKPTLRPDLPIVADAKVFISALLAKVGRIKRQDSVDKWLARCQQWKKRYPVMQDEYRQVNNGVNSYFFVETLGKTMKDDAIVVTDVGAGFISTMQSLPLRPGQRLFHSGGVSSMGYGFPASIGACFASNGRQTICLTGDGGMMFNLQELQTVTHHRLPLVIFVFANNGYMTMQYTQMNHFGREAISSPQSGLSCPDFVSVARAFGIKAAHICNQTELTESIGDILASSEPFLCELQMPEHQLLIPRVQTRVEAGRFVPTPIEDMYPFLERAEFKANMIVDPINN